METRIGYVVALDYGNHQAYLGGGSEYSDIVQPWIYGEEKDAKRVAADFRKDVAAGCNETGLKSAWHVPVEYGPFRVVNPTDPGDPIRREIDAMADAGETR